MTQKIGRYEIIEEIGSGGFAAVFKARDTTLERDVAVKIMRPLLMSDADFVARFRREAQVAANLQHPNIIPVYDYGEDDGRLFLVMKLMTGSLGGQLSKGPLSWEQAVTWVAQAAAGLDFAHAHNVIHRDIKPDNLLLDALGNIVLADLGVVKALEKSTITVSLSGGILGTPAYMAPEVWNGETPTAATDIYALACVFYEMITGGKLFDGPTPPAIMTLHFREAPLPAQWPERVPPGVTQVLRRALATRPADRYPKAADFTADLAALAMDPLAEPYEVLQAALREGKWLDALAVAEKILARNPRYRDVTDLMQQALQGKAAADQAALAAQWREQAEAALANGEWETAQMAAQRWLQLAPDAQDAQTIISQAKAKSAHHNDALSSKSGQEDLFQDLGAELLNVLNTAKEFAEKGKFDLAIDAITQLLMIFEPFVKDNAKEALPYLDRLYRNRANYHIQAKNIEKALEDYNKAVELNANSPDNYMLRGAVYYALGRKSHAITDLKKSLALKDEQPDAWSLLIKIYSERGDFQKAIESCGALLDIDPRNMEALAMRGQTHMNLFLQENQPTHLQQALADFNDAIEEDADRANLFLLRGQTYFFLGNNIRALEDLNDAVALEPNTALYWHQKGVILANFAANQPTLRDYYHQAIADLTKAIDLKPLDPELFFARGNCFSQAALVKHSTGSYESAITDYTKAIELNPNNPNYFYSRGICFKNLNKLIEALQDFQKAASLGHPLAVQELQSFPMVDMLTRIGVFTAVENLIGQKEFQLALDLTNQFITAFQNQTPASLYALRGNIFHNAAFEKHPVGNYQNAIDDYTKAIELDPSEAATYYLKRGMSHFFCKQFQVAKSDFEESAARGSSQAKELLQEFNKVL